MTASFNFDDGVLGNDGASGFLVFLGIILHSLPHREMFHGSKCRSSIGHFCEGQPCHRRLLLFPRQLVVPEPNGERHTIREYTRCSTELMNDRRFSPRHWNPHHAYGIRTCLQTRCSSTMVSQICMYSIFKSPLMSTFALPKGFP